MAEPLRGHLPPPDDALARGLTDSALLGLGAVASTLLGLASLRLLLTGLSEEDFGRYCLFQVAAGLLVVLLAWPCHAVLRLGAEEVDERGRLGRTYGSVLLLILASLAAVAGAGLLFGGALEGAARALLGPQPWGLVFAFAAATALAQLAYSLLQPAGRVGMRTLFPALNRGLYAGVLALVFLGQGSLTLEQATFLLFVTALPLAVLPALFVARRLGRPSVDAATAGRALSFGWPLLCRNLGVVGLLYVDVLAIRWFYGAGEGTVLAGRYDVAYRIAEQVVVFGFILEFLAGPALAAAAARRDRSTLKRFYGLAAPPAVWAWGLGAALVLVLAEPCLTLLGARSPGESAAVLKVLMVAVAVRGAGLLESAVFDAHLLSRWPAAFFFVGLAVNIAADLGLLQAGWGIVGPAVGTALGFTVQAVLRAAYLRARLRVPALRPYLGLAPVVALLAVDRLAGGALWVTLPSWALAAAAAVALGRWSGALGPELRAALEPVRMPSSARRLVALVCGAGEAPPRPGPGAAPPRPGPGAVRSGDAPWTP